MIAFDLALQFALIAAVLGFVPGPDNTCVLMQSALGGTRQGIALTLGLCSGLVVHTAAVALGVAAIFQASALAFTVLKIAGAAYLLWLAWGAFRAVGAASPGAGGSAAAGTAARALYLRGIVMNLSNPKVAVFFLAFLPQFVRADAGPVPWQVAQLGAVFIVVSLADFCLIAVAAGRLSGWLRRSPRAVPLMNGIAGCIFVALAARLATAQR